MSSPKLIDPESRIFGVNVFVSIGPEMTWRQVGANPFLEPMLTLHSEEAKEQS